MTETVTIYMPLQGEGMDVWAPVRAESLGGSRYRLPGAAPVDQNWAFAPGTVVEGAFRQFQGGESGIAAIRMVLK